MRIDYFTIFFLLIFPPTISASPDAVRINGDLKTDGIHFSTDGSVLLSSNNLLKHKGDWSSSTLYSNGDVVKNNGISYICINVNTNKIPPDDSYWSLIASSGAQGPKGEQGLQGIQGTKGDQGVQGPPGISGIITVTTPPSSSSDICTTGESRFAAGYLYYCYSNNIWLRSPFSSWLGDLFNAPLLSSLATTKGNLTFSRFSEATVSDNAGALITVSDGMPSFPGMRAIRNSILNSANISTWGKIFSGTGSLPTIVSGQLAPDGTRTAFKIYFNQGTGGTINDISYLDPTITNSSIKFSLPSVWAKTVDGTTKTIVLQGGSNNTHTTAVTGEWRRIFFQHLVATSATSLFRIGLRAYYTPQNNTAEILLWHPQYETFTVPNPPNKEPSEYIETTGVAKILWESNTLGNNGVALGDSFTNNQKYLDYIFDTTTKPYINSGISGNTLESMLARFEFDVSFYKPKSLIIMGGINNLTNIGNDPNTVMRTALQSIVFAARTASIPNIIIANLPPFSGNTYWSSERQTWLESYNLWLQSYCATENITLFDMYNVLRTPGGASLLPVFDSGDGLHPNNYGYSAIATGLKPLLPERASLTKTPITGTAGILSEKSTTNVFNNPLTPTTQDISVTSQAYSLSFYGTGLIVASGASQFALNGSGANSRVIYVFTPSVGKLTLTLSGNITAPQLETGTFATSPSLSSGITTERSATVITGTPIKPYTFGDKWTFRGKVTLDAYPNGDNFIFSSYIDESNYTALVLNESFLKFRRRVAGSNIDNIMNIPIPSIGIQYDWSFSILPDGRVTITWAGLSSTYSPATTPKFAEGSKFQLGSLNSSSTLCGKFNDIFIEDR